MNTIDSIFTPQQQLINGITNARNAVVSFVEEHGYFLGQILSFRIPKSYGMYELNNKQATVVLIPSTTTVVVDVETTNFNTFLYPVSTSDYPPTTIPSGSGITYEDPKLVRTNLQCCFDNQPVD